MLLIDGWSLVRRPFLNPARVRDHRILVSLIVGGCYQTGARNQAPILSSHTMPQCEVANLWQPRADQFFHIDALPYLGTGKLDLRKAREIAAGRSAEQG